MWQSATNIGYYSFTFGNTPNTPTLDTGTVFVFLFDNGNTVNYEYNVLPLLTDAEPVNNNLLWSDPRADPTKYINYYRALNNLPLLTESSNSSGFVVFIVSGNCKDFIDSIYNDPSYVQHQVMMNSNCTQFFKAYNTLGFNNTNNISFSPAFFPPAYPAAPLSNISSRFVQIFGFDEHLNTNAYTNAVANNNVQSVTYQTVVNRDTAAKNTAMFALHNANPNFGLPLQKWLQLNVYVNVVVSSYNTLVSQVANNNSQVQFTANNVLTNCTNAINNMDTLSTYYSSNSAIVANLSIVKNYVLAIQSYASSIYNTFSCYADSWVDAINTLETLLQTHASSSPYLSNIGLGVAPVSAAPANSASAGSGNYYFCIIFA
jgi:hypothetical protein